MTDAAPRRRIVRVIVLVALVAIAGGGFAGWQVWRISHHPLRYLPGVLFVCEIDADHPFDDGRSRDEVIARTVSTVTARLDHVSRFSRVDAHGARIEVQVPAWQTSVSVDAIKRLITRSGRLEFKVVDDDSAWMREVAAKLAAAHMDGVQIGHDAWTERDSGRQHTDPYLSAGDEATLRAAFASTPIPPDHEILVERRDGDKLAWRSYYVYRHARVTGENIEDAEVSWNPDTGRPEVSLGFDKEGAEQLEAVSGEAVGRKLAIVLEGRVQAAPFIESKISGGRALITMAADPDLFRLQQETKDLVAVLRTGGLAAPVRIVEQRVVGKR
jgi:preprotein translocase subunit SecD